MDHVREPTTNVSLHSFQEAVDCIDAGGAAGRYGKYPRYSKGWLGELRAEYVSHSQRFEGFSLEDQKSNDWVLTSPEEYETENQKAKEWYREQERIRVAKAKEEAAIAGSSPQAHTQAHKWYRRLCDLVVGGKDRRSSP